jgi:anti-anti-sigma factor
MRPVTDAFSVTRTGPGVWAVVGELDLGTAPTLEQALCSDPTPGDLRLDCSGLVFMDSQGIRSLLAVADARPPGGRLVLEHVTREVRRIADLVQLAAVPAISLADPSPQDPTALD